MNEEYARLTIKVGQTPSDSCIELNGKRLMGVMRIRLEIDAEHKVGPLVELLMSPELNSLELPEAFKALVKVDFMP